MENSLNSAIILLTVGMITVFLILSIVVYGSKLLIYFVNQYAPEMVPLKKQDDTVPLSNNMDKNIVAAISATIHTVTQGKGKVAHISKR